MTGFAIHASRNSIAQLNFSSQSQYKSGIADTPDAAQPRDPGRQTSVNNIRGRQHRVGDLGPLPTEKLPKAEREIENIHSGHFSQADGPDAYAELISGKLLPG